MWGQQTFTRDLLCALLITRPPLNISMRKKDHQPPAKTPEGSRGEGGQLWLLGFVLLLPRGSNPSVSTSQYCFPFLKTLLRIKCRVGTLDDFRPCPDLASITLNSLMKKPCPHSPLPVLPWPRGEGLHVTSLFKKQGAGSGGERPWHPRLHRQQCPLDLMTFCSSYACFYGKHLYLAQIMVSSP